MSTPLWLRPVVDFGPGIAFLCALAVTPGVPLAIALTIERRRIVLREQYRAFLFGDVLLAVAIAASATCVPAPDVLPVWRARPLGGALAATFLGFGLLQWRMEVANGSYTVAQALSPSKVWHQLIVYPVTGCWLVVTVTSSIPTWSSRPVVGVAVATALAGWGALAAYDCRHVRLGHVPFDWGRLRSSPQPWATDSATLRAHALR